MTPTNPQITLYQYGGVDRKKTMSHPCGKVHMALTYKKLDYTTRNLTSPGQVKKHNTRGRVPILMIDGERLVDSTDIVTELDRRFPDPPLMPSNPAQAAQAKILEDWADEVLYFYGVYTRWCVPENFERIKDQVLSRLPVPLRWLVPGIAKKQVRIRTNGQGVGLKDPATVFREVRECLDTLDTLLSGGGFAVSDTFTRADLCLASVVDQFSFEAINPDLAREVAQRKAIVAWQERVRQFVPSFAG